ncbi:MAG: threonylcarbamoyl-AMP synthase [Dysgonamonadaceae bacterium]|jgi:L-threonylcarbamoyladenylate synthase|nr:threonylcarbamoyl-AMP synthase [Dysgonamonadaceae bacterium]
MHEEILKTCEVLNSGGIIIYPTDTVWGVGCDATNEEAVARVYEIKRRQDKKSMIVLVDSIELLDIYTDNTPEIARQIVEIAVEPLTIIYPHAKNLAQNLISEDGSIAIRVTKETFSQTLCRKFGKPVVSTSANFSGQPTPTCFNEINTDFMRLTDYVVNYRNTETDKRKASSIIGFTSNGSIKVIRK